jgi:aldehyde:ferredoxin oxidoreductase
MAARGYAGRILRVDLATGKTGIVETAQYASLLLGGRGIAAGIYWDEVPPSIPASDPANRLIVTTGPLAGIPALGGSRWAVCAKSAVGEREHFCYGNLGGSFGAELRFAGFDGLVIQGKADAPVMIVIQGASVSIVSAADLWGKGAVDARESVKARLGERTKVFAIGPAGENLVPFATILADGDASCSGGMGAVMGSKNLKAVAVRGEHAPVDVADPDALREIARRVRGFGRGNVKVWGFDFMAHGPKTKKMPCYGCMASCLRVRYTADNGESGKFMCQSRFFYSPYAWLFYGEDNDVPYLANRACDQYGVDTWKLQEIVDWLVRCAEAGALTEERTGLPLSKVGSMEFIDALVPMVALRRGFGELLARGALAAARELGEPALSQWHPYDPYEPRFYNINTYLFPFEPRQPLPQLHEAGLALSQWASWRKGVEGAHITTEVFRGIARRFWGGEAAADLTTLAGKALAARLIQDRQHAKECLIVCDWMFPVVDIPTSGDHVGDPGIESAILQAVTGGLWTREGLDRVGERLFNLQRAILLREGHRAREEDVLHSEWHDKPLEEHIGDPECLVPTADGGTATRLGARIEMTEYLRERDEYYRLRGWDAASGLQTRCLLGTLGLPHVAESLAGKGLLADDPA